MTLFPEEAALRVLILWAGSKRKASALSIRDSLRLAAPSDYAISVITEDHSDPLYDALSEDAIKAADCVLMIASEEDWRLYDSAIRERQFFNALVRRQKKTRNQFRFVRVLDEEPPIFANGGLRPLTFRDPNNLARGEIETALNYLATVKFWTDKMGGTAPPDIKLSAEALSAPSGLLAATMWVATLDEEALQPHAVDQPVSSHRFLEALRRMKALHSVHSGLGAMIKGPMNTLQQELSAGTCCITRVRSQIASELSSYRTHLPSPLDEAINDCIAFGLLPTLRLFARRLAAMPAHSKELLFVEAAMERLAAILDDRAELDPDVERYDGAWWVDHYHHCLVLVQKRYPTLISDLDISSLIRPRTTASPEERQFGQTITVAHNLLASTLQLTFLVLVIFSFLHAHLQTKVDDLVPENVEDAVEQLAEDWRHGYQTDFIVKWSNQMILCLLAAVSGEEVAISAAA